jgi:hypothetical protein
LVGIITSNQISTLTSTVVQKFSKDTCGALVRNRIWLTPIIGSIFGAMALTAYILRMVAKLTINGQIGTSGFGLEDISLSLAIVCLTSNSPRFMLTTRRF